MHLPSDLSIHPMHLAGNIGGIPHLAKNERDVGHPSFVREPEWQCSFSKAETHRCLKLPGRADVVRSPKGGVGWTADVIAKLGGYRTKEVRSAIHLIDVLHVNVIDQVEGFHTGCSLDSLAH